MIDVTKSALARNKFHTDRWLAQDFFDLAVSNKTRPEIHQDLAKLAAQSAGVSQAAVLEELSFPPNDPHPGSNISKVATP